ncbi:MAG: pyruvate kinase [Saprospiraceae bacterium]
MNIQKIEKELFHILQYLVENEANINEEIVGVHKDFVLSAKNLFRYLMLRSFDLRKYHDSLSEIGISSIRTAEGYVLSNLFNVVKNLRLIQQLPFEYNTESTPEMIGYKKSKKLLKKHSDNLFHVTKKINFTEIMVTLPNEAADDKKMIRDMVINGMDIARINLSHGNKEIWRKMIAIIQEVREETSKKVKIYMDLSGPKIRTSDIQILGKKGKIKNSIPIRTGDHIIITKNKTLGKKSIYNEENEQLKKAEISVTLDEIIDDANIGDLVLFDDGMIKSKVFAKTEETLEIVITDFYKSKISAHKGINLPNTKLHLPALTKKDIEYLPFICKYADMVGYSFVRSGDDVDKLYAELDKNKAKNIGIVFKIENQEAFENLPDILIAGMKRNKIGVMIARGDLAVEIGFERISEVQNEILWLCESAHIPVIWATQVLENLATSGIPTRAEISDAALGSQAECVMLNKGPHINDAIHVLKDILVRMKGHTYKKKNELRALNVSKRFVQRLQDKAVASPKVL